MLKVTARPCRTVAHFERVHSTVRPAHVIGVMGLLVFLMLMSLPAAAQTPPSLTVTGVSAGNSNVKVSFTPFPGAKDYRVYDLSNPSVVKYAGMVHLDAGIPYHFVLASDGTPVYPYTTARNTRTVKTPQTLDVPSTQIDWNSADDRLPHTLVVEALDQLGPVPGGNLSDASNNPVQQPAGMLGSNTGPTLDGKVSTDGQGPTTNSPTVLAQSQPFVVQANGSYAAIPSTASAAQTFFDTFENSEGSTIAPVGTVNGFKGTMQFTMNPTTPQASTIFYEGADTDHSMPFIKASHFMDMLFEGITPSSLPPGSTNIYHNAYANMSLSPAATADFSGGQVLHLTEEVDSHLSGTNRWLAFQLAPALDPLTEFQADDSVTNAGSPKVNSRAVNSSNKALWIQLFPKKCDMALYEGTQSGTQSTPIVNTFIRSAIVGAPSPCNRSAQHLGGNGVGFDNKERWDVFLTTSHIGLFEDGKLVIQSDIPDGGLGFTQAKVYFTHYVYAMASDDEKARLRKSSPFETYWLNYFQYSDERHWDNMGFEVLPATSVPAGNDFTSLGNLIRLPAVTPPVFVTPTATPTP